MRSEFSVALAAAVFKSEATQSSIARELEVSTAYLSDMKLGNRHPTPRFVNKLCVWLGCGLRDKTQWHVLGARTRGWEVL